MAFARQTRGAVEFVWSREEDLQHDAATGQRVRQLPIRLAAPKAA